MPLDKTKIKEHIADLQSAVEFIATICLLVHPWNILNQYNNCDAKLGCEQIIKKGSALVNLQWTEKLFRQKRRLVNWWA